MNLHKIKEELIYRGEIGSLLHSPKIRLNKLHQIFVPWGHINLQHFTLFEPTKKDIEEMVRFAHLPGKSANKIPPEVLLNIRTNNFRINTTVVFSKLHLPDSAEI